MTPTYTVTGDADDMSGWTATTLAAALRGPLGELGVSVKCEPRQSGGGGLRGSDDDILNEEVKRVVENLVTGAA